MERQVCIVFIYYQKIDTQYVSGFFSSWVYNDLENIPRQRSNPLRGFADPRRENISTLGFFSISTGIFHHAKNFPWGFKKKKQMLKSYNLSTI